MAAAAHATKDERLEARVSRPHKKLFERAASLSGLSLTDFVVSTLEAAATSVVQRHTEMNLSTRDCEVLVDALLNPPAPSARLREAMARHKARKQSD